MNRYAYKLLVVIGCAYAYMGVVQAQTVDRAPVVALLITAQEAIKEKKPEQALQALDKALLIAAISGADKVTVARLRVAAALDSGKPALAMAALEYLISATEVPTTEKPSLLEATISLAQKQKDHQRVLDATKRYEAVALMPQGVRIAQAQAYYFLKDYAACANSISTLLSNTKDHAPSSSDSLTKPPEYVLRMLADSHNQLKNRAAYTESLELLLRHYPSASYWSDYLSRQVQKLEPNSSLLLDWYRLMRATLSLEDGDDFLVYAELALKAGLPIEALHVFELGEKQALLNTSQSTHHQALKQLILRRQAQDTDAIDTLNAHMQSNSSGNTAAQLADLHFAASRWEDAQKYYAQGVAIGLLRKEEQVRLRWGIAAALQRDRSTAISIWKWDGFDVATQTLIKAWKIWLDRP